MATTPTSQKNFAERVNFDKLITDLHQKHGISLTEEEQEDLRKICIRNLKQNDGNSWYGGDIGGSVGNVLYMLFAFIQNLVFNGKSIENAGALKSTFADAFTSTTEQNQARLLNDATIGIYEDLTRQGGKLASIAEHVSGQRPSANGINYALSSSVFTQIAGTLNYDMSVTTGLDARAASHHNKESLTGRS